MSSISYESVRVFVSTDEQWERLIPEIERVLGRVWPEMAFASNRLERISDWRSVAEAYGPDDVILLQGNDDHALIQQGTNQIGEMVKLMNADSKLKLGAITHHPEMQNLASRLDTGYLSSATTFSVVPIEYAIGTTLVRGDFFKSWWEPGKFEETDLIVRPDNPWGRSVTFESTLQLIPAREVFRHMDGYSHTGLYRPLAPLRNIVSWCQCITSDFDPKNVEGWKSGLWPRRVFAYSGRGCDIHETTVPKEVSAFSRVRNDVATLQAGWALRVDPRRVRILLGIQPGSESFRVVFAASITVLTFPVMRNLPDRALDIFWVFLLKILPGKRTFPMGVPWTVGYLGWSRAFWRWLPISHKRTR